MQITVGNLDWRKIVLRGERAVALEREQRLVEVLSRVGEAVAVEDDLEQVVQLLADEATALVSAPFGGFVGSESGGACAGGRLYALAGWASAAADFLPPPLSEILEVTLEGAAAVRRDVPAAPGVGRDSPREGMPGGDLLVRSYLAVPVFADGETVGALFFGHEDAGAFDKDTERTAGAIAALAGLAISQARRCERERRLRAAAQQRSPTALILDHVADGVVLVDPAGLVRVWNRAAERITGLAASEVLEHPIGEVLPGWQEVVPCAPVEGEGEPKRLRPLLLGLDDRVLWLSFSGMDSAEGVVYTFRDVTGEREAEESRADLITTVSHEIRTPAAAVYGAARTLLRGGLQGDVRERLLGILVSESERLASLVGEILLAGAIDAGRLAVARDEVDLVELARKAVECSEVAAGHRRLELELPAAASVVGDADRVGQVFANLLENAFKYAGPGEDAVTVRVLPQATTVRVEICDRGPGIPELEQERIFEKFHRLDLHLEGGVRGSGLGLYISRELVLRMQGTIGVESVEGEGAAFWFELPRFLRP